jgi:hypothetical protein
MPVTTRKAKPQAKNYEEDEVSEFSDDDTPTFDKLFGHADNSDSEPDFRTTKSKRRRSQGKTAGKKSKGKKRKSTHTAALPEMSDDEDRRSGDTPELDDYPVNFDDPTGTIHASKTASRRLATGAQVLQIHVDATKSNGKATINLNLADLISCHAFKDIQLSTIDNIAADEASIGEEDTLVSAEEPKHRSKRAKLLHEARSQKFAAKLTKRGFADLPYELRVGIYREIFVKKRPLHFTSKEDFSRSAQFLRTCKLVSEEGREIMYGENSFHFSRSSQTRGTYFESDWKEIGFKDARRFFEDIGPANISLLKYVSFALSDAPPSVTPYLEEEQRRCVNDPVLHRVFKLLGSYAMLNKFAIAFQVRRTVIPSDYVFLKALSSIRSHKVSQPCKWWSTNRLSYGIMDRLQKVMVIKEEEDDEVDISKKKTVEPEMYLD